MRFGSGLRFVYTESWAFIRRGWWLAILPSLPLLVHTLFGDLVPPRWDEAALWSAIGLTAVLQAALAYCVVRFIALRHDLAAALAVNPASGRTFAPYLIAMSALNMVPQLGTIYAAGAWISLGLALPWLLVSPLLSAWSVTAPSGSTVIGPIRSARLVLPHFLWSVVFLVLAFVPLVAAQVMVQVVAFLTLLEILGPSSNVVGPVVDALFTSCGDVISLAAVFAIADRAGVRIGADRTLAAVFD